MVISVQVKENVMFNFSTNAGGQRYLIFIIYLQHAVF